MNEQLPTNIPDGFTCKYCYKVFKRESAFERHRCKEMERYDQVNSVQGAAAFSIFNKWMIIKQRTRVTRKTFGESKQFIYFFKFVKWMNVVKIPDVDKYIAAMVIWDFMPSMWMTDQVYTRYIEYLDVTSTVDDHIKFTYDTLTKVSQAAECKLSEVFDVLEFHMLVQYMQARKLSPWVLIKIPGFKRAVGKLNDSQKQHLEQHIRPIYWGAKMKEFPKETQLIVDFVQTVGL